MIAQKFEEITFANEQIAGMISCGIPLEGAILKVAENMRKSAFKNQITFLAKDLSDGVPFEQAVNKRDFPDFYKKMMIVGAKTDKLPETLTAVADYYRKKAELTMKLSGLMVYPAIVFILTLVVSASISFFLYSFIKDFVGEFPSAKINIAVILFPSGIALFFFILFLLFFISVFFVGRIKNYFSWRMNPFKDANLSNMASLMKLCLNNGIELPDALGFISGVEGGSVQREFHKIRDDLSKGFSPADAIQKSDFFPGTFKWLIHSTGGNLAEGFGSASEVYKNRAESRTETLLYTALPFSIILLAVLIIFQLGALISPLFSIINCLGG